MLNFTGSTSFKIKSKISLGYFWNVLQTNYLTEVAKILGILGNILKKLIFGQLLSNLATFYSNIWSNYGLNI